MKMQYKYQKLALWILFLLLPLYDFASHMMGGDLTYQCIGGNTYRFRYVFYRDCSGISAPTSVTMTIRSSSCGVNTSIVLSRIPGTGQEITPLCPSESSTCTGGSFPGAQEYVYEGTYTLPNQCTDWVFGVGINARNNGITTIQNPGSEDMYVQATLNNVLAPCNSSPQFLNLPVPYVCLNQSYVYNNGTYDTDGDFITYTLITPMTGPSSTVTYLPGFSATSPISSSTGTTLSPAGDVSFTPTQNNQITVMAIRVEEYRNGQLIGSVIRDIQVIVRNCNNVLPAVSGINGTSNYSITVCPGQTVNFTINGSDPDAGQNLTMNWNNGIPTANFTVAGQPPVGTFTWTPTYSDTGANLFTVTIKDDACPIVGNRTYSFTINVQSTLQANFTIPTPCLGSSSTINVNPSGGQAPYTITWSGAAGLSGSGTSVTHTYPTTGTYTFQAFITDAQGCQLVKTGSITILDTPIISITPRNPIVCNGSSVVLTATGGTSWSWNTGENTQSITVTPSSTTTYEVTTTGTNGCIGRASVTVVVAPPPPPAICNTIFVTTSGNPNGSGTKADPVTLGRALQLARCNNSHIKVASGTYNTDTTITAFTDNLVIEGGYDPVTWNKSNAPASATIIHRTANNIDLTNKALVAIQLNSVNNFRLQDLTITTADLDEATHGFQLSTYGLHLKNCSGYQIVRCNIRAGNATDGQNGTSAPAGQGGAGGGGIGGAGGAGVNGCGNPSAGTNGTPGNGGAGGGSGSDTGSGGLCCGSSRPGPGGNGGNGANGISWAPGDKPTATLPSLDYFVPNSIPQDGTNGFGGGGGGGGGGSRGGTCACINCAGNNGGAGGNGGGGGLAGTGGTAGGAVFTVYSINSPGNFIDCSITKGNFGTGGIGGNGQPGAPGQPGQPGANGGSCLCGNPQGADGGNGGNGGNGGRGRDGADGISANIYVIGTAPSITVTGSAQTISAGINNPTNYNFSAEPIITVGTASCTQRDVQFSTSNQGNWDLGASATNPLQNNIANPVTQYSNVGVKTIVYNSTTYSFFWTINSTPLASTPTIIASEDTICPGESIEFTSSVLTASNFEWQIFQGPTLINTISSPTADTINQVFASPGTYTIRLVLNSDCCGLTNPVFKDIFVGSTPTVTVNGDNNICEGETTTLYATGTDVAYFVWNPGNVISDSLVVTPSSTTTYTVFPVSPLGCIGDTIDFTVTVNPTPTVTVAPALSEICYDDTVTLTASSAIGTIFEWNRLGDTVVVHTGASFQVTGSNAAAYEVVAISPQGCRSEPALAIVSVLSAPQPFISTTDSILCIGDSTTLFANGAATYRWTLVRDGVPFSTANSVVVSPGTTTTYYLYGVGANGCPNPEPDSILVIVNNPPAFSGPTSVCEGSQGIVFTASDTSDWSISGTNGSVITSSFTNTDSIIVNFGTPGTNTITLTNVLTGCDTFITVTVNPNPVITGASFVCEFSTNQVYTSTISGNWLMLSNAGASFAGDSTDTTSVLINFGGTETVVLQVTDANGCIDTFQVVVQPTPEITGPVGLCVDQQGAAYTSSIAGDWTISGINATITSSATDTNSVTVDAGNITGSFTLRVVDINGCQDSIVVNVTPKPVINAPTQVCAQSPSVSISADVAGDWSISSAQGAIITSVANDTNQIFVSFGNPGTETITITNSLGCTQTFDITVLPLPIVNGLNSVCEFTQNGVYISGESGTWNLVSNSGSAIVRSTTDSLIINFGATGVDSIFFTNSNGCIDTFTVTVNPLPQLTVNDDEACSNDVVTLEVSGNPSGGIFAFYTDASASTPFFVGSSYTTSPVLQDTTIFVEYIAAGCTSARLPVHITHQVRPTINVTWTPNPAAFPGNSTVSFQNNTTGADTYQWDFGNLGTSTQTNPIVTYNAPGNYTVILTAINTLTGCVEIDTFTVIVNLIEEIEVPNVFTPNGDFMNDNFVPTTIGVMEYELIIYDRWGKKVFDNEGDMNKLWNGKLMNTGGECADGVYYYRFKAKRYNGETFTRFGNVTLLR